jgi:hypothetical protein
MAKLRLFGAVVAGLVLASLPFFRYAGGLAHRSPHMDHTAHHGGQLGMAGERHIELLRRAGRVEVFVSDSQRRSLTVSRGRITFDGVDARPLVNDGDRLIGEDVSSARNIEVSADLDDGTTLIMDFAFAD